MEQNQSLFGLNLDEQSKGFLGEAARWGRFLAIIGFIVCALVILVGAYMASAGNDFDNAFSEYRGVRTSSNLGVIMAVVYIIIALIWFFPCLYLLRFSNKMKAALAANDQVSLTSSFQNLKSMFKFVGVLTIIILSFYILLFLVGMLGRA